MTTKDVSHAASPVRMIVLEAGEPCPKPFSKHMSGASSVRTLCILLPAGSKNGSPIRIPHEDGAAIERVVLIAEVGAEGIVFEQSSCRAPVMQTEVFLEAESTLSYIVLMEHEGTKVDHTFHSHVGEGAKIHWHLATIGGAKNRHALLSRLIGRNAESSVDWIFFVQGQEAQSVSARNIFAAENGGGEMTLKGVAAGTAKAECDGMIEITEQGRGTNTYLTEDVLMLDASAHVDAVPGLEIRTNDVKASHSATVSRVTEEDLFYLQSRGIPEQTARKMFVDGFLSDVTERIPHTGLRGEVLHALMLRLPAG